METIMWIILGLIIILAGAAIYSAKNSKKNHKTDYYSLFVMGIVWFIIGIPLYIDDGSITFFLLGLIFTIIGLTNKDKWKKDHKTWNQLSKKEKRFKIWVIIILSILVLIGLAFYIFQI